MNTDVIYVQKDFDNGDEDYEGPAIVGSFDGLSGSRCGAKEKEHRKSESRDPIPGDPHPRIRSRLQITWDS